MGINKQKSRGYSTYVSFYNFVEIEIETSECEEASFHSVTEKGCKGVFLMCYTASLSPQTLGF